MTTRFFVWAVVLPPLIAGSTCRCSSAGAADASYEKFTRLAEEGKRAEALELGGRLFATLVADKPHDATLVMLAKRLDAARRIDALVAGATRPDPRQLLQGIAGMDDLARTSSASPDGDVRADLLPAAQDLYWAHQGVFTGEMTWNGLPAQQAAFPARYYDLQMQETIMKIGRRATVTDPNSLENACYALVLPLLYLHGRDNAWDRMESFLALFSPSQLDVLWQFSLLQAERPQASVQIARYLAGVTGKEFSLAVWAPAAADACIENHRLDLAEESLRMAISGTKDRNTIAELWLKIVESRARSGDYAAAAQTCKQIADDQPEFPLYGRAMAMYFGYLARAAKADQIVVETEPALQDPRCKPYLAQILYLRWWALCKTKRIDEAVQVAQRLLEQYPGNPCVAPVLLERAADALARQQYDRCRELLMRLTRDFPGSESAKRAGDILTRLQNSGI